MRPYEMMVLFHPDVEDHKVLAEEIGEVVKGVGGEVSKIDHWGKRRLAYPVDKKQEGYYTLYQLTLDPGQVKELDRLLHIRANVMRHMVVRKDEL
ncbi:MAG TPA: 30S ribosomal protein S6 [Synergistaceae bacterium]|nr:30S ribosomal protein S6 [Synergistaceae bacterium]HQK24513.1 30S ribosomal protein S6 [Synergistaceae bacterium]